MEIVEKLSEVTIDNRPPIEIEESFHMLHIKCINAAYDYLSSRTTYKTGNNNETIYFYAGIALGIFLGVGISNWDTYIKKWFL